MANVSKVACEFVYLVCAVGRKFLLLSEITPIKFLANSSIIQISAFCFCIMLQYLLRRIILQSIINKKSATVYTNFHNITFVKLEILIFPTYDNVIDTYFLIERKIQKQICLILKTLQSVEIKLFIMKYNGYK